MKSASDVDIDDALPTRVVDFEKWLPVGDPGICGQDVDPPESLPACFDRGVNLRPVRYVGDALNYLIAICPGGIDQALPIEIDCRHPHPFSHETLDDGATNPVSCPGDNRDLVLHVQHD